MVTCLLPTVWPSNFLMEPPNSSSVSNIQGEEADWCSTLKGRITESYWKAELILTARSNGSQIATCLCDLPGSNWNVVINFLHRSDVTCCLSKGQEDRGGWGRSWRLGWGRLLWDLLLIFMAWTYLLSGDDVLSREQSILLIPAAEDSRLRNLWWDQLAGQRNHEVLSRIWALYFM